MTVDRDLLRAPFVSMRAQLEQGGFPIPDTSTFVADQVRASWRFDLSALGLDTTNRDHLAGALAGFALGLKQTTLQVPDAPPPFYVPWVRFFEILEPLLDSDSLSDADMEGLFGTPTSVTTPWGELVGRDMTQAAERLAAGNDVPRYDLNNPDDIARLAGTRRPQVGGPIFQRVDKAPEAPVAPVERPRGVWRVFRDAYRTERARRRGQ